MRILFLVFFLFSSAALAADPVKVGLALRSGPELNSFAPDLIDGIEFAREQFEMKHPGSTFELVRYPHQAGHASVDQSARRILDGRVQFVIGGEMSDEAFALAEQFHDHQVVLVTPTASNSMLSAGNPNVFLMNASDDQVAKKMAQFVAGMKGVHSIGVLQNTANSFSDDLTNRFLEHYEEINLKEKATVKSVFRFATESPDFKGAVRRFKDAGVDLVVAFTLQESLKSFSRMATEGGIHASYVGSDGWGTEESITQAIAQKQLLDFKGVYSSYWHPEANAGSTVRFRADFKKKFSKDANSSNAMGYDAAYCLFEAIRRTQGKPDPVRVIQELKKGTFPDSVTVKSIRFNQKNGVIRPLNLYQIDSKGSHFLKSID